MCVIECALKRTVFVLAWGCARARVVAQDPRGQPWHKSWVVPKPRDNPQDWVVNPGLSLTHRIRGPWVILVLTQPCESSSRFVKEFDMRSMI